LILSLGLVILTSGAPSSAELPVAATAGAPISTAPSRPRSRVQTGLAVVAVVVVVVVLLSLLLSGVFNGGSGASPGAASFSAARSTANATAGAHGAWILTDAVGFDPANATTFNTSTVTAAPGCNLTSFSGPIPPDVTWQAFHGDLTSGVATVWVFDYYQPSSMNVLAVFETGAVVSFAFELSGPACTAGAGVNFPLGNAVDSSVAVANAAKAGASGFLKLHPAGVSLSMETSGGQGWFVRWTTCSLLAGPFGWIGNGSQFSVVENETTGAVMPGGTYNGTCGGPPPIGIALGLGTPSLSQGSNGGTLATQGCTAYDYCYSVPIVRLSLNVTPADISIGVFTGVNGGSGVNSVVGYAVIDSTGRVVVSSSGPDTGAPPLWSNGTGTPDTFLSTTMHISVDMGTVNPAGLGYALVVSGWAPFNNSPYYAISLP
jgi:hypothetical protein